MTGPLAGVRVLDAATLLAAPLSASLLAEFGAEVVKLERPGVGDPVRHFAPLHDGTSLHWKVTGRGKRSVTADLHTAGGREVFRRLTAVCDVLVVNYRPDTLKRWGLDYPDLLSIRPDLVMLHVTAFGRSGPYGNRPGFARVAEAFAGLTYRTGHPNQPPTFSGYPIGDGVGGIYGAFAVLLALRARDLSGKPQLIDLGLFEPVLRMMEDFIVDYGATGTSAKRHGNASPLTAPNDLYPTKDDQFIVLPASTDQMWSRLVDVIGDETLRHCETNADRLARRDDIDAIVRRFTSDHTLEHLLAVFGEAGIACGPVNSAADIVSDPQVQARQSILTIPDAETGADLFMQAPAGRFSGFTGTVQAPGAPLGQDTNSILEGLLGFKPEDIDALRADSAI